VGLELLEVTWGLRGGIGHNASPESWNESAEGRGTGATQPETTCMEPTGGVKQISESEARRGSEVHDRCGADEDHSRSW